MYFKKNIMLILCTWSFLAFGSIDYSVVPDASYYVYGAPHLGISQMSSCATFYTFDGEVLQVFEFGQYMFPGLSTKLDRSAPKPRPIRYKVEHNTNWKRRYDYAVLFFDKNNIRINVDGCYGRINKHSRLIDFEKAYDLSLITDNKLKRLIKR